MGILEGSREGRGWPDNASCKEWELVASDAASNHEAVAVVHVSAGKAVVDNADTTASVHTATASDVDTTSDDEVDNDTATDGGTHTPTLQRKGG